MLETLSTSDENAGPGSCRPGEPPGNFPTSSCEGEARATRRMAAASSSALATVTSEPRGNSVAMVSIELMLSCVNMSSR